MIVKDESDIIINTLTNILDKMPIKYWVICDTGSTDNTPNLIETFFLEKGISGELIHDEWKDFAYNRTRALEFAYKKTDFVFIFDADDRIVGDLILPDLKKGSAYHMQFGHDVRWKRLPLLDNHIKWYYEGVMHEIIGTDEQYKSDSIGGNYHIATNVEVSARNKKGSKKFYDDAIILVEAYNKNDKLQSRYGFYAAECFRFSGKENWNESIEWYKKVVADKRQWIQEKYWACYQMGKIYDELDQKEKAWYYYFKSYEFDDSRQEAFFELIKKCRAQNKFKTGYELYKMLKPCLKKDKIHKLFVINHIYEHSLYSEIAIILYYLKENEEVIEIFKKLFLANITNPLYIQMTNNNIKYFIPHIKRDDWEFYGKFKRYCLKFTVPENLKKQIDKVFID
jgi:tetratricopeptide (TPR) repeat protein|tara:strand:+ start:334 stop:1521 length:1188 start_codon:yes stop_codon:yes gene_type:complete